MFGKHYVRVRAVGILFAVLANVVAGMFTSVARADLPVLGSVPVPPIISPPTPPQPETLTGDYGPITDPVAEPTPGTFDPTSSSPPSPYTGPAGYVAGVSVHTSTSDTANTIVYANPDGTHSAMVYGSPVNFQANGSQVWQPIDTTIVAAANGALRTVATPTGLTFSPLANGAPMVSASTSAGTVGVSLLGASAYSPATPAGSMVDYLNVLPETNLDYFVGNDFLKTTLEVLQPPPPGQSLSYSFPLSFPGNDIVSVSEEPNGDYQITLLRTDHSPGTVITIPTSIVYDSAIDPRSGEPRIGPAYNSLTEDPSTGIWTLEVTVEPGWLDSPGVTYPIFVDPTFTYGYQAQKGNGDDSFVQDYCDACKNTNFNSWKPACCNHGYFIDQLGYFSTAGNNFDYFHYELSSLNGTDIISASWKAYFSWVGDSRYPDYWIHPVAGAWNASTITWNSPFSSQPYVFSDVVHGQASTTGTTSNLDIKTWVNNWTHGVTNNGIEVDTTLNDSGYWKNIASDENGGGPNGKASYILVNYDSYPSAASTPTPADGSPTHTAQPTLSVSPASDPDGDAVQYEFVVAYSSDVKTNVVWSSGVQPSPSVTLPQNLSPNRPYYWQVWTYDGTVYTLPTSVWSFTPTDAAPTNPRDSTPADGASVATMQPTLYASTATDPDSQDTVSYVFTIYSGPDGSGQVMKSAKLSSPKWAPPDVPARVLNDGATYYWSVQATDGWLASAPSSVRRFKVDLGLGSQPAQSYDTLGPTAVNLANGNLFVPTALPSFKAVGGSLGLGLAYNSEKPTNQGLTGYYFNDTNGNHAFDSWEQPQLTRIDSTVAFDWKGGSAYPGLNSTNLLVRWQGLVSVPATDSYMFGTVADDGSRIWIGPQPTPTKVFDNWVDQPAPSTAQFQSAYTLTAGSPQPITIEYYQAAGGDTIQLWAVAKTSGKPIPVPASWLTTNVPGLPDGWTLSSSGGPTYTAARISDKQVIILDAAGRSHGYNWTGSSWVPPVGEDGALAMDTNGQLTLHADDGMTYVFSSDGTLSSVTSATDDLAPAAPVYTYSPISPTPGAPSLLTRIADPLSRIATSPPTWSRSITLVYAPDPTSGTSNSCPSDAKYTAPPAYMLCKVDYNAFGAGETDLFYSNGHLARIVNPGSAITDFGYDSNGRLTKVRDVLNNDLIACGPSKCSSYYGSETASQLGADTKHMWLVGYSGSRVASVTAPLPGPNLPQPAHTYSYDSSATRVHDALIPDNSLGYVRKVVFDSINRTLQDFDLAGKATATNTWDTSNNLLSSTDATGIETTHVYDAAHRPTDSYGPGRACLDPPSCSASEFASDGTSSTAPHSQTGYDENMNYLSATWWGNKDMAGSPLTHSTYALQSSSTLPSQLPGQNVSGRLTGELDLPSAGVYGFNLTAAGGARLYLDDQKILDDWGGPYFSAVQSDKPSEYWRLGEQSGLSTANDVEQLHPGTYATSAVSTPGALSGDTDTATTFNGSNQYVSVGSDPGYFGGGMTIELWANPSAVGSYARFVDFGNGPGAENIVLCRQAMSNDLELAIFHDDGTATVVTAPGAISLGTWQHFAATITPSGAVTLYKNGVQVGSGSGRLPETASRKYNYIGKSNWTTTGDAYYQGSMDDVALYPAALSATRILAHYQAGSSPSYSVRGGTAAYPNALKADFPLSYWRLDEPAGSTSATDLEQINSGTYVADQATGIAPTLGVSDALTSDPDTAVSFNGTNQYVSVTPQDTVTGSYSVEAWVKPSTTSANLGILGTRAPSDGAFDIQLNNGKLHGDIGDGTNWLTTSADAPTVLNTNTWYQVVYAVSGGAGSALGSWAIYVNGSQVSAGTLLPGTPMLWNASHQLEIGGIATGNQSAPFNGSIDDVSVYGIALSAAEVANHYTAGTHPTALVTGASAPLSAGAHRIRIEYQGLAAPGQLSLTWTPPNGTEAQVPSTDLSPRFGLVTSGVDADGKTGQIAYTKPILGLPTSTIVDPGTGHLNLTSTTTYEAASSSTYYRVLSTTLPSGTASRVSDAYYGATETVSSNPSRQAA